MTDSATRIAALRRAGATAVVSMAGFALGYRVLGSVQVAVFATFAGLALLGIAEFAGPVPRRSAAIMAATAAGTGLVTLGTWAARQTTWVDAAITAFTAATLVMSTLLGVQFLAACNALTLFYLVAVGSPAPISVTGDRVAGVALGGALSLVGAALLLPEPGTSPARATLARELTGLARRLEEFSTRKSLGNSPAGAETRDSPVREAVAVLESWPVSPTRADRSLLYLVNDAERLDRLLRRIVPEKLTSADRLALGEMSTTLGHSVDRLIAPRHDSHAEPQPGVLPPAFSLLARIALVVDSIVRHVDTAAGRTPPRQLLAHAQLRLRAQLRWTSVHAQDALRMGAALGAAVATARIFSVQHGFWVALATLTIVRSNVAATARRAESAVAGTTIGFAVAFALIEAAGSHVGAYAALAPVAIFCAIFANLAIGFVAGQAAFTVAVLLLFSLLAPAGWDIGLVRVEDVVAGAGIGLAVATLAWPRGPAAALGPAIANLLVSSSQYLIATVSAMTEGAKSPTRLAGLRNRATSAAIIADSAFAAYLADRPARRGVEQRLEELSVVNRLWYAADLLRSRVMVADRLNSGRALAAAATALAQVAAATERRLRSGRGPGRNLAQLEPASRGLSDDSLEVWLADMAAQLDLFKADNCMILVTCRPRAGADLQQFSQLLPEEAAALRTLAADGTLVQAWTTDRPGAILLLDTDAPTGEIVLANLPLARAGLLEFQSLPVRNLEL